MSISYKKNPSNLILPVKVNSKLIEEYMIKDQIINYDNHILNNIYTPKIRDEIYYHEDENAYIKSLIPRRFYYIKKSI